MALFTDFEIKEFDSASLTGSYQNFGAVLTYPCYEVIFFNGSDVDVYVSLDGTTDNIRVASGQSLPMTGFRKYSPSPDGMYLFKKGEQLQIKQVTGTGTGFIVINCLMTR
jgi:hypothetical protein